MKIIYGNSSQKTIDRNQRITNRERRKRREKVSSTAKTSRSDALVQGNSEQNVIESHSVSDSAALENNNKSIPHEISLIKANSPSLSTDLLTDSSITKEESKGVIQNENKLQPTSAAFDPSETQTSTATAASGGLPSTETIASGNFSSAETIASRNSSSESVNSVASDNISSNDANVDAHSDAQHNETQYNSNVSEFPERGRGIVTEDCITETSIDSSAAPQNSIGFTLSSAGDAVEQISPTTSGSSEIDNIESTNRTSKQTSESSTSSTETANDSNSSVGSIVFWNESGTEAATSPSCSSRSPEGRLMLHKLNQILHNEVHVFEILLPANHQDQIPMVIFVHEENAKNRIE